VRRQGNEENEDEMQSPEGGRWMEFEIEVLSWVAVVKGVATASVDESRCRLHHRSNLDLKPIGRLGMAKRFIT